MGAWHSTVSYHCAARLRLYVPVIEALLRVGADPTVVFLVGNCSQVSHSWDGGCLSLFNMHLVTSKVRPSHTPVRYVELRQLRRSLGRDIHLSRSRSS